jgi:hypothetical protein
MIGDRWGKINQCTNDFSQETAIIYDNLIRKYAIPIISIVPSIHALMFCYLKCKPIARIILIGYMLLNKTKDFNRHPYQPSLSKNNNNNYNPVSTRCMSVAKPPQNSNQVVLKPIAPPKQLTVPTKPLSTISARATTKP